jgi:hypothetical protein
MWQKLPRKEVVSCFGRQLAVHVGEVFAESSVGLAENPFRPGVWIVCWFRAFAFPYRGVWYLLRHGQAPGLEAPPGTVVGDAIRERFNFFNGRPTWSLQKGRTAQRGPIASDQVERQFRRPTWLILPENVPVNAVAPGEVDKALIAKGIDAIDGRAT